MKRATLLAALGPGAVFFVIGSFGLSPLGSFQERSQLWVGSVSHHVKTTWASPSSEQEYTLVYDVEVIEHAGRARGSLEYLNCTLSGVIESQSGSFDDSAQPHGSGPGTWKAHETPVKWKLSRPRVKAGAIYYDKTHRGLVAENGPVYRLFGPESKIKVEQKWTSDYVTSQNEVKYYGEPARKVSEDLRAVDLIQFYIGSNPTFRANVGGSARGTSIDPAEFRSLITEGKDVWMKDHYSSSRQPDSGVKIEQEVKWALRLTPWGIRARFVDQDEPENTAFETLSKTRSIVYGGSQDSTSDNLTLVAALDPGAGTPTRYIWSVAGPGSAAYQPPLPSASAVEWEVGEIAAEAGTLEFRLDVELSNGSSLTETRKIEVGIRTDDVLVIGWINPNGVPLSPQGVHPDVLTRLPHTGQFSGRVQKMQALVYLASITGGNTSRSLLPPWNQPLSQTDKEYILNWMFFHASNSPPPTTFADEQAVAAYLATRTNYKLANRLQIKYRVLSGQFRQPPIVLRRLDPPRIGETLDPVLGMSVPGSAGGMNGRSGTFQDHIYYVVNDGSPDSAAVAAFNTLMQPLRWSNIGSIIEMGIPYGTDYNIRQQLYPTYVIYRNLTTTHTIPQAAQPSGNFSLNPYPPNTPPYAPP